MDGGIAVLGFIAEGRILIQVLTIVVLTGSWWQIHQPSTEINIELYYKMYRSAPWRCAEDEIGEWTVHK